MGCFYIFLWPQISFSELYMLVFFPLLFSLDGFRKMPSRTRVFDSYPSSLLSWALQYIAQTELRKMRLIKKYVFDMTKQEWK